MVLDDLKALKNEMMAPSFKYDENHILPFLGVFISVTVPGFSTHQPGPEIEENNA
jgi:hypothetical protein